MAALTCVRGGDEAAQQIQDALRLEGALRAALLRRNVQLRQQDRDADVRHRFQAARGRCKLAKQRGGALHKGDVVRKRGKQL